MPVGLYRIPKDDAEKLGYEEAYIMGEYDVKNGKIIIGRSVYDYDEKALVAVDPKDFVDVSGRPMKEARELFSKYGAEVDIVFAIRTRKGSKVDLVALVGGKVKE